MDNLFVLFLNDKLIGIYTNHRKANQAMILTIIPKGWELSRYEYDMGVEFFIYYNEEGFEETYTIKEITPDARV